jgi:hypothetical protein
MERSVNLKSNLQIFTRPPRKRHYGKPTPVLDFGHDLTIGSNLLPWLNMSQPVKISDGLLLDARLVGEAVERSIAGQIELWAKIGRAIEPLLRGDQVLALTRAGEVKPLSACLVSVDSVAGRRRVAEYLESRPFPHYEAAEQPGLLVRIEADGRRTAGRFVNRQFEPAASAKPAGDAEIHGNNSGVKNK